MTYNIVTRIEKINKNNFLNFVFNHPKGNIFQSPELYEFYEKLENFRPFCTIVFNQADKIVGS